MSTNARREPPVFFTDRDLGKAFPQALRAAGLSVETHVEHFAPNTSDEEWLKTIGDRGWIALTHDTRIRYRPYELAAVQRNSVGLLVVVGKAPLPELAAGFVATLRKSSTSSRHKDRHSSLRSTAAFCSLTGHVRRAPLR